MHARGEVNAVKEKGQVREPQSVVAEVSSFELYIRLMRISRRYTFRLFSEQCASAISSLDNRWTKASLRLKLFRRTRINSFKRGFNSFPTVCCRSNYEITFISSEYHNSTLNETVYYQSRLIAPANFNAFLYVLLSSRIKIGSDTDPTLETHILLLFTSMHIISWSSHYKKREINLKWMRRFWRLRIEKHPDQAWRNNLKLKKSGTGKKKILAERKRNKRTRYA